MNLSFDAEWNSQSKFEGTAFGTNGEYFCLSSKNCELQIYDSSLAPFKTIILKSPLTIIKISPFSNVMICVDQNESLLHFLSMIFCDELYYDYEVVPLFISATISCVEFTKGFAFLGAQNGAVYILNLSTKPLLPLLILQLRSPVNQIHCEDEYAVLSSTLGSVLINSKQKTYIDIGSKLRNGKYGSCLLTGSVYSARPGNRIWKVDLNGQVLATFSYSSSEELITYLYPLSESFLLTYNRKSITLIDVKGLNCIRTFRLSVLFENKYVYKIQNYVYVESMSGVVQRFSLSKDSSYVLCSKEKPLKLNVGVDDSEPFYNPSFPVSKRLHEFKRKITNHLLEEREKDQLSQVSFDILSKDKTQIIQNVRTFGSHLSLLRSEDVVPVVVTQVFTYLIRTERLPLMNGISQESQNLTCLWSSSIDAQAAAIMSSYLQCIDVEEALSVLPLYYCSSFAVLLSKPKGIFGISKRFTLLYNLYWTQDDPQNLSTSFLSPMELFYLLCKFSKNENLSMALFLSYYNSQNSFLLKFLQEAPTKYLTHVLSLFKSQYISLNVPLSYSRDLKTPYDDLGFCLLSLIKEQDKVSFCFHSSFWSGYLKELKLCNSEERIRQESRILYQFEDVQLLLDLGLLNEGSAMIHTLQDYKFWCNYLHWDDFGYAIVKQHGVEKGKKLLLNIKYPTPAFSWRFYNYVILESLRLTSSNL